MISGDAIAVEVACARAREQGARRAVPLEVSAPFHCSLMRPAAEKLALELARVRFRAPEAPIVTNVEANACRDAARFPALLEQQVTAPVRFTEMIEFLARRASTACSRSGRVACWRVSSPGCRAISRARASGLPRSSMTRQISPRGSARTRVRIARGGDRMVALDTRVSELIVEQLGVSMEEIRPEASFIDDLGADSLDIVELVMAMEEEFDIEIPDEDAERIQTIGDATAYLKEKLGA